MLPPNPSCYQLSNYQKYRGQLQYFNIYVMSRLSLDQIAKEVMLETLKKSKKSTKSKKLNQKEKMTQEDQDNFEDLINQIEEENRSKKLRKTEKENSKIAEKSKLSEKDNDKGSESDDEEARLLFQQSFGSSSDQEDQEKDVASEKSSIKVKTKEANQNKSRKVTFNEQVSVQIIRPETNHDPDRKWASPIQNQIRGRFSPQQQRILIQSMCKYCISNNMQITQLCEMITQQTKLQKSKKLWTLICSALPRRSMHSCFKFIKRRFDTRNYKGKWTQEEEERLADLVDQHGRKWTKISKIIGRTPENVRDKFDLLERGEQHVPFWSIREILTLLRGVQTECSGDFLSQNANKLNDQAQMHDTLDRQQRKNRKNISKNFIFHNLKVIIQNIDYSIAKQMNFKRINWRQIARMIGTKNKDECRMIWNRIMILQQMAYNPFGYKEDKQLIKAIQEQEPENQQHIDFRINNGRTEGENRQRWKLLKRFVSGRLSKAVDDVICQIKLRLKRRHQSKKLKQAEKQDKKQQQNTEENTLLQKLCQQLMQRANEN